jgi:hypothetical protein
MYPSLRATLEQMGDVLKKSIHLTQKDPYRCPAGEPPCLMHEVIAQIDDAGLVLASLARSKVIARWGTAYLSEIPKIASKSRRCSPTAGVAATMYRGCLGEGINRTTGMNDFK